MDAILQRRIITFVETARTARDEKAGAALAVAINVWFRYYRFIDIILMEYKRVDPLLSASHQAFLGRPSGLLTPNEMEEMRRGAELTARLHLQVESFYVFTKILLDRIAETFGFLFDKKFTSFGSTHVQLKRGFPNICATKGLRIEPTDIPTLLVQLETRIVKHRTDIIEHLQNPATWHATVWGADQKNKIVLQPFLPPETPPNAPPPWQSEDLDELILLLNRYVTAMIDFFEVNIEKSALATNTVKAS